MILHETLNLQTFRLDDEPPAVPLAGAVKSRAPTPKSRQFPRLARLLTGATFCREVLPTPTTFRASNADFLGDDSSACSPAATPARETATISKEALMLPLVSRRHTSNPRGCLMTGRPKCGRRRHVGFDAKTQTVGFRQSVVALPEGGCQIAMPLQQNRLQQSYKRTFAGAACTSGAHNVLARMGSRESSIRTRTTTHNPRRGPERRTRRHSVHNDHCMARVNSEIASPFFPCSTYAPFESARSMESTITSAERDGSTTASDSSCHISFRSGSTIQPEVRFVRRLTDLRKRISIVSHKSTVRFCSVVSPKSIRVAATPRRQPRVVRERTRKAKPPDLLLGSFYDLRFLQEDIFQGDQPPDSHRSSNQPEIRKLSFHRKRRYNDEKNVRDLVAAVIGDYAAKQLLRGFAVSVVLRTLKGAVGNRESEDDVLPAIVVMTTLKCVGRELVLAMPQDISGLIGGEPKTVKMSEMKLQKWHQWNLRHVEAIEWNSSEMKDLLCLPAERVISPQASSSHLPPRKIVNRLTSLIIHRSNSQHCWEGGRWSHENLQNSLLITLQPLPMPFMLRFRTHKEAHQFADVVVLLQTYTNRRVTRYVSNAAQKHVTIATAHALNRRYRT